MKIQSFNKVTEVSENLHEQMREFFLTKKYMPI